MNLSRPEAPLAPRPSPQHIVPKRLLVIRLDRLGDVILSTPVLQELRRAFPHLFERLDTVHFGHPQVHQDQIGLQQLGLFYTLSAIPGLTYDLEVGLSLQHGAQSIADHGVVVDNENASRCFVCCHIFYPKRAS